MLSERLRDRWERAELGPSHRPAGIELVRRLADTVGPAVHRWLRQYERSTLDEMNGGSSKRIGTASIKESNKPKSLHFKTSGAWYELFFKVS